MTYLTNSFDIAVVLLDYTVSSCQPSPVPRPTGLVVKNGSKIRRRTSSDMPHPLSEKDQAHKLPPSFLDLT